MAIESIRWMGGTGGYLRVIDQSQLPARLHYLSLRHWPAVYQAIQNLKVRGAPLIGVGVGFGLYLGARSIKATDFTDFYRRLNKIRNKLLSVRPTAVNLKWALARIMDLVANHLHYSPDRLKNLIFQEAKRILKEDKQICSRLGQYGSRLIKNKTGVLTYCNAGALATAGVGTALAAIYQAKKQGKKFRVYVPETRPMLQGARLTAWELSKARINVTLLCDNMIGQVMNEGKVDLVILGADRITARGDVANKIGTYSVALLAYQHKIPFYVVAPLATFDLSLKYGKEIPIEYRKGEEVSRIAGRPMAPVNIKVYNPAFDVTPARLVRGIITEAGIIKPPYYLNIFHIVGKMERKMSTM